ncbi:conserved hypothetical protein [Bathymodiolus platifrons methanotrophic gill symbiont]|uniref:hypothetical protein n=1 Tax=Bathymodiolus platifrons methanotrophic gill symbiont TaxID=113268 RepID=UPI000B6A8544|nr:hypothetical protein [Bathymodiolus platifrons methanotrophic gill symbiont]GAW85401.1 conserved hypothetical protein [Bathymodiolus platifrons methanotrophic gill symbiont]GFO75605.1 hypothetical protein BPLS_P2921 [Bathymodiolus platifrons methanotrophic gill symbiont]
MKQKITLTSKTSQRVARAIHLIRDQTYTVNRRKINFHHANNTLATLAILLFTLILPATANAHRGAKGEVDTCRISVGKEVIHFSAYTPSLSGGKSFCHVIPEIGLTDLVIDYEGKKLRHTTVEFEVTKEPEGSRVYYHKPEKIKKGSVDAKVDFRQYGAGNYLLHVTVVNEGETIDSHLPFSVGIEQAENMIPNKILIPFIIIVIILAVMFGMSRKPKQEP